MDKIGEQILRRRMHGLYLSRGCEDLQQLSRELLGMHCWFHRNVVFSAQIRWANLAGWKQALTKTWLYRGTLHAVAMEDLPTFLALHTQDALRSCAWLGLNQEQLDKLARRVLDLMEDGVFSRGEMRQIFAYDMDPLTIERCFSPWGGIFVYLARQGLVAFRDLTSRDFDLIDAQPTRSLEEVLPECLRRFFAAYGPATLADAAQFFGLTKESKKRLFELDLEEFIPLEYNGETYYATASPAQLEEIPPLTLLSGFDPYIVSYANRELVLPPEYKKAVILSSGICLPTVAIHGQVAGLWNLKNGQPSLTFFRPQPQKIQDQALHLIRAQELQATPSPFPSSGEVFRGL